jgi:predicted PurR-regulated permease PerM
MAPAQDAADRWSGAGVRAWTAIGVLVLVGFGAYLLRLVFPALTPFIIGLLVALLLRRPVGWLVTHRVNRTLAVALCYLAALAAVAVVLTFIIPPIYVQIVAFVRQVPVYVQRSFALWDRIVVHPRAGGIPSWLQSVVLGLRDQVVAGAGSWSGAIASSAVSTGGSIATGVIGFVLALIIGFYTLADLPRLEKEVLTLVGTHSRAQALHVARTMTRVLGGWLRGTLLQSGVIAVLLAIGFWIAGVPYALALGVIGGVLNVVPYLGPAITIVLAAAAGLFVGPWTALWAVVVIAVVQILNQIVVTPRIMSRQMDMHPLLVILALLVGAELFGIPGMVLSLPVAAIVMALFVYSFERRTERRIGSADGVLFRDARAEGDHAAPSSGP